jgi:hypothetical protein
MQKLQLIKGKFDKFITELRTADNDGVLDKESTRR